MKVTYPLLPIVVSGGWRTTMPVHLRYEPRRDPYAIDLVIFPAAGRAPVTWLISRDLLRDGLTRVAGEAAGDVRITPGPMSIGVHLNDSATCALIVFARDDVQSFMDMVFLQVPDGGEGKFFDWDREMELLA
jgi:hypothetical protein